MKGPVIRNPGRARPTSSMSTPGGARQPVDSLDLRDLSHAAVAGNRAARRVALRALKKKLKATGIR